MVLGRFVGQLSVAGSAVTAVVRGLALILIAYRLINPPGGDRRGPGDRARGSASSPRPGHLGGYLGMQEAAGLRPLSRLGGSADAAARRGSRRR